MKVGTKLTVLVLLAMPGLVGLVMLGQHQMDKVFVAANYSNAKALPGIVLLSQALDELANVRTKTWQHLSYAEKENRVEIEQSVVASMKKINELLKQYERGYITDDKDGYLLAAVLP